MATYLTVVGNAGSDPELRFTQSGTPVCTFSIAVNRKKKNAAGEWEDAGTDWYRVNAWRELAENVASTVEKGQRVVVHGRLEHRPWQAEDGSQRLSIELQADEVAPSLRWATAQVTRNEKRGGPPVPDEPPAYDGEEPF